MTEPKIKIYFEAYVVILVGAYKTSKAFGVGLTLFYLFDTMLKISTAL